MLTRRVTSASMSLALSISAMAMRASRVASMTAAMPRRVTEATITPTVRSPPEVVQPHSSNSTTSIDRKMRYPPSALRISQINPQGRFLSAGSLPMSARTVSITTNTPRAIASGPTQPLRNCARARLRVMIPMTGPFSRADSSTGMISAVIDVDSLGFLDSAESISRRLPIW